MRQFAFLAALTAAALVTYIYLPNLFSTNNPLAETRTNVAAEAKREKQFNPPILQREGSVPTRPVMPATRRTGDLATAKMQPKSKLSKPEKMRSPRPGKKVAQKVTPQAGAEEAINPGLAPLTSEEEIRAVTGLSPESPKNGPSTNHPRPVPTGTVKDRWVKSLSGADANLSFAVTKDTSEDCAAAFANCQRIPAPKDISLAGVVVKSERAVTTKPLDGRLVRGHYLNRTPAVFVK